MTAVTIVEAPVPEPDETLRQLIDDRRTRRGGWWIAYITVLAVIATGIIGGRVVVNRMSDRPQVISAAHPAAPFPSGAAVETVWGIRFTNVMVLAANGGVELRYQVIDDAKAAKIHQGAQGANELPTIEVERTGATVAPSAVLMHFHHGDATAGRTYSIIYGNSGGAVASGELVTIVMKDGLKIEHIQVTD